MPTSFPDFPTSDLDLFHTDFVLALERLLSLVKFVEVLFDSEDMIHLI